MANDADFRFKGGDSFFLGLRILVDLGVKAGFIISLFFYLHRSEEC